jgi:hypothetical protein
MKGTYGSPLTHPRHCVSQHVPYFNIFNYFSQTVMN